MCLYVDDLIFTRKYDEMFDEFKKPMMKEFEMTDQVLVHCCIEVIQTIASNFIFRRSMRRIFLKGFIWMNASHLELQLNSV